MGGILSWIEERQILDVLSLGAGRCLLAHSRAAETAGAMATAPAEFGMELFELFGRQLIVIEIVGSRAVGIRQRVPIR